MFDGMMLKPDQERIRILLSETITLLCRNGLNFKTEFSIEALIGITLDHSDVFLVSIKETIQSPAASVEPANDTAEELIAENGITPTNTIKDESSITSYRHGIINEDLTRFHVERKKDLLNVVKNHNFARSRLPVGEAAEVVRSHINSSKWKWRRRTGVILNNTECGSIVKRARSHVVIDGSLVEENRSSNRDNKLSNSTVDDQNSVHSTNSNNIGQLLLSKSKQTDENQFTSLDTVRQETTSCIEERAALSLSASTNTCAVASTSESLPSSHNTSIVAFINESLHGCTAQNDDDDESNIVCVKTEPDDNHSSAMGGGAYDLWRSESDRWRSEIRKRQFGISVSCGEVGLTASCSSWSQHSGGEVTGQRDYRPRWLDAISGRTVSSYGQFSTGVSSTGHASDSANSLVSVKNDQLSNNPPPLSVEQIFVAVEILSICGSFVNIGSAKAVQHSLRRLNRRELSEVLDMMCVPPSSPYCVGQLCTAGASRVFYKAPPDQIGEAAQEFYRINLDVYSSIYYSPVRVPHSVREPIQWTRAMESRNPYYLARST